MSSFCCPVCQTPLIEEEKRYCCKNGHSFDKAKSGYVNLLLSQKSKEKRHGDDKAMVKARCDFLDCGYYDNLRNALLPALQEAIKKDAVIIDAGCGEGFYTAFLYENLKEFTPQFFGIDISKNALEYAAKRKFPIQLAVASIYNIPMADESADVLLNVFAPHSEKEYARVLKKGGKMVRVIPLAKHLYALKAAVYDEPYENKLPPFELAGFTFLGQTELKRQITLQSNEDIKHLFMMTPYYYKTSAKDFAKLESLKTLSCETEFCILSYQKD